MDELSDQLSDFSIVCVQQPIGGIFELGEVDESTRGCRDDDQVETYLGEGLAPFILSVSSASNFFFRMLSGLCIVELVLL